MGEIAISSVHSIEDAYEILGGFGSFQLFALITIVYPELPTGILGLIPVCIGTLPEEWTCITEDGDFPISRSEICECNGTLFGGESSIVSEWNLVCENAWVTEFITSVQMAGMLVGGIFGAGISDQIGRKKSLYLFCTLGIIGAGISGFTNSPFFYAACTFVKGAGIASFLVVSAIYSMEFLTLKSRSLCGTIGLWGYGVIALALFSYEFPEWRLLSKMATIPLFFGFVAYPWLPESPRWLLQKGRVEEAKIVFEQIARWNNRPPLDPMIVEKLAGGLLQNQSSEKFGYRHLFMNGKLRRKLIIFMAGWFSVSLLYYALSFNTKNLGGNLHLNIVYMGLTDAVGFPTAIFFINILGRKMAYLMYMILASGSLLGIVLMQLNIGIPYNEDWIVGLSLGGKLFICGAWGTFKLFTVESFPTTSRGSAVSCTTVAAAIGGIIAPQIVYFGTIYQAGPFFIFATLSLLSTGLSLLLSETKGKPIVEDEE